MERKPADRSGFERRTTGIFISLRPLGNRVGNFHSITANVTYHPLYPRCKYKETCSAPVRACFICKCTRNSGIPCSHRLGGVGEVSRLARRLEPANYSLISICLPADRNNRLNNLEAACLHFDTRRKVYGIDRESRGCNQWCICCGRKHLRLYFPWKRVATLRVYDYRSLYP